MSKFQRRHTKVGVGPGSLLIHADASPFQVRVMAYTEVSLEEREITDMAELTSGLNRVAQIVQETFVRT